MADGFYRMMVNRMYYVREEKQKYTPKPFFEIRVLTYLNRKPTEHEQKTFYEKAVKIANIVEWSFDNIVMAVLKQSIKIDIEGLEVEPVDADEFTRDLRLSGAESAKLNEVYVYCGFHKKDGKTNWLGQETIRHNFNKKTVSQKTFRITDASDEQVAKYIAAGKAWWTAITLDQYLRLKKRLGY